ncbi:hypothetical protein [Bdellovibrio bacteriovorus]|uniref:Uncharacterized protein n=1 Tax=Bdellovibrio bacteriovorus TaxID=959 RepID=A0A1Z3N9W4_BDEBC|nr:hypothetical protein [Bdellovibrio bacteriovorus]ASD64249.1 hypothetical protein B9G79_12060 [Bdellovibrio bacteriovorus]
MNRKNRRKDKFSHWPKEMELVSRMAIELSKLGIELSPHQRRAVVSSVRIRTNFLSLQNSGLDKRSVRKDLQFRMVTLSRSAEQLERDQNPYEFIEDDFIKRQLFLAVLEKAFLIQEEKIKSNIRDAQAIDFHLWVLHQILVENGLLKPTHVLTAILKKVGYWRGFGESLKVGTVQNRISRAKKLVDKAIKKKACHMPKVISEWPRWNSEDFVSKLSQGCPKCAKIWDKILGRVAHEVAPWDLAIAELKEEIPYFSEAIGVVADSLGGEGEAAMPLPKLLDYLPHRYQGAIMHLFVSKLFV